MKDEGEPVTEDRPYYFAELARLYGAIGLLCMQDRVYGLQFINQVQRRIAPSVRRNRYRLYSNGDGFPLGFAHWACVNDATLRRLSEGDDLAAEEWEAGAHPVCIDLIVRDDLRQRILTDLFAVAFPSREAVFRICRQDANRLKELRPDD